MLGAIIGDVIGSIYERQDMKSTEFPLFGHFNHMTDDTVLTVAVAHATLNRTHLPNPRKDKKQAHALYADYIKRYGRRYESVGYGQMFRKWLASDSMRGYGSYGNGSAMRVSPIGFAYDDLARVLYEAQLSANVTHNHPEGIKGAQAVAAAVFLARTGTDKSGIRDYIEKNFGYDLGRTLSEIRPNYTFDATCQGSVPESITAFLESNDFEDAIRKAISLSGDSDTIACIAGSIAHAYYKQIPKQIVSKTWLILDGGLKPIIKQFNETYEVPQ